MKNKMRNGLILSVSLGLITALGGCVAVPRQQNIANSSQEQNGGIITNGSIFSKNEKTNKATLTMNDGFVLTLTVPDYCELAFNTDSFISIEMNDRYCDATYSDSLVAVGDKEEILDHFKYEFHNMDYDICTATLANGSTCFYSCVEKDGWLDVSVLQEVGAENYLEIEITDYSDEYVGVENYLNAFLINLS